MPPSSGESSDQSGHLPDDAVVVRGGVMDRKLLVQSAKRYADRHDGVHAISVFSWPGLDASAIALRVQAANPDLNPLGHGQFRTATAEDIRRQPEDGQPFELVQTGREGHYTLIVSRGEPSDADWDRLDQTFGPRQPNPAAERR